MTTTNLTNFRLNLGEYISILEAGNPITLELGKNKKKIILEAKLAKVDEEKSNFYAVFEQLDTKGYFQEISDRSKLTAKEAIKNRIYEKINARR